MPATVRNLSPVSEPAQYAHIKQPACFDDATWAHICCMIDAAVEAAPPLSASQRQIVRDAFHTPVATS